MITFDDYGKKHIIRIDNICITPTYIKNILFVDDLKHNLFSISQFYDKFFIIIFESLMHIISSSNNNDIMLIGYRHSNIYMVDLNALSINNDQWLFIMDAKINETS